MTTGRDALIDHSHGSGGRAAITVILSALFTVFVLHYSIQHGRLAANITYDDVGYITSGLENLRWFHDDGLRGLVKAYRLFPPHAPLQTLLAMAGFAFFGVHDWAPYAASGLVIFFILRGVAYLMRGMPLFALASCEVIVLSVPLSAQVIHEFRPDLLVGASTALVMLLLIERAILSASRQRRWAIGVLCGWTLWAKPSVFPVTLALSAGTLFLSLAISWLGQERRPAPRRTLLALTELIVPALLIPLPHFLFHGRQVAGYIWENVFGARKAVWSMHASRSQHLLWHLTGHGGQTMLGWHLYLLGALSVLGAMASILRRPQRLRSQRGPRAFACGLMLLAAYVIPTINWQKQEFLAADFDFLLIFGAVLGVRQLLLLAEDLELNSPVASHAFLARTEQVALTLLAFGSVSMAQWPIGWATRGTPKAEGRRQIAERIYRTIAADASEPFPRIWLDFSGSITAETLGYLAEKQGQWMRFESDPMGSDLSEYSREYDRATFVVASDPDNEEPFPDLPSTRLLGPTLTMIRGRPDFIPIATFRTWENHHYYLFERVSDWCGWERSDGLGPREGPFPEVGTPAVRVGYGPETRLHLADRGAGEWELRFAGAATLMPQRLSIWLDGKRIRTYDFAGKAPFTTVHVPLKLAAGQHDLRMQFIRWDGDDPAKPGAVAFSVLQIVPKDDPWTPFPRLQTARR